MIRTKTAKIIYSQTPNEFGEEAVKHYIECDSYQASPDFCLPPTAIQTKPVINDKDQQTRQWVEMDFSITALIPEMDFSEYKTKKRVEMDFSMTTQEPVEQV